MSSFDQGKPLRILFVNRMASMERGGGETFDLEMIRHLVGLGCRVTLLTGHPLFGRAVLGPKDWWGQSEEGEDCRLQTVDCRLLGGDTGGSDGSTVYSLRSNVFSLRSPYTGWFPWDKVRGGWRLRAWDFSCFERAAARWVAARADEFDVVQVCELPELVSELKRRAFPRPVVMRVTAPNVYDPTGGTQKADAVIASGTSIAKYHAGPRPDCVEVPNGVDVTRFRPQATDFRIRHGIGPDEFVVLYVARFQAFKNHAMLVEAFRLFRESLPAGAKARLVLVGSGPLRTRVEAQVAAAGLSQSVLFLGEIMFAELPAIYAASDLKAISSDYESFCFAVIEAMASGLPVVSTDCGWVPRLMGRGGGDGRLTMSDGPLAIGDCPSSLAHRPSPLAHRPSSIEPGGWITPVGDAPAFAAALREAWENPDVRAAKGRANRLTAEERHTWTASARKLLDLYQRLCPVPVLPKA